MLTRTTTPGGNTSTIDFGLTETVLTSSTTTTAKYYFVAGQRVAEQVGSTFSYLIPNLEGSPTVALSSTGSVSAVQLFLPYGASGFAWGTMPTAHNYTDQLLDSVMGLLYYGARWYDPLADQFVSADSVQGNPSGMNPYGYVTGNPETLTDPTGQEACPTDPQICEQAPKVALYIVTAATGVTAAELIPLLGPLGIIAASLGLMWAIANQPGLPPYKSLQPQPAPTPSPSYPSDPFVGHGDSPVPSYYQPSDPFVGHEDSPVPTPMSPQPSTSVGAGVGGLQPPKKPVATGGPFYRQLRKRDERQSGCPQGKYLRYEGNPNTQGAANTDIPLNADGTVSPGTGGYSLSSESGGAIPSAPVEPANIAATGKLQIVPDPSNPTHFLLEPAYQMPVEEYIAAFDAACGGGE